MATQQWGRKETVVWPPNMPVYSYSAVVVALFCTVVYMWARFTFAVSPLQQFYTPVYIRAVAGSALNHRGGYQMIYVGGPRTPNRIARPEDVQEGSTAVLVGKPLPLALSAEAISRGEKWLYRGPRQVYKDKDVRQYLHDQVWEGERFREPYRTSYLSGFVVLLALLPFSMRWDIKRRKVLKYGRLLKGPVMVKPTEFNKVLGGDGLGIRIDGKEQRICIPRRAEAKHIQMMGDTGVGKSTLMLQTLSEIAARGESAIVYDPAGEMIQRFYSEKRKDWILNPLDARSPYWTPTSELRTPAEARTIAASLYQPTSDKKGEFFTETPQKIFAHLLKYRPTPQELVAWMSKASEIDARVAGTELASMVAQDAPDQRNGVLASLGLIADSLRLLPTLEQSDGRQWSATEWAEKREGWIFLTSTEATQAALRPLQSMWLDLLILRLLTLPKEGQKRAWFLIDELATLQRLPQLDTALTKGRKSDNPIIFTYQGKAQLEVIYGHLAEVMLSQPATKYVMKTAEPKAAKWASELLGEIEIERLRESVADGKRSGKNLTLDRQVEPLVLASEIEGLSDLHAFVKHGNYVSRFSFPRMDMPIIAEALVERKVPENDKWLTLPTEPAQASTPAQPAPSKKLPLPTDEPTRPEPPVEAKKQPRDQPTGTAGLLPAVAVHGSETPRVRYRSAL